MNTETLEVKQKNKYIIEETLKESLETINKIIDKNIIDKSTKKFYI